MRGAVVVVAAFIVASAIACGSFGADDGPKPSEDAGTSGTAWSSSSSSSGEGGVESGANAEDLCAGASYCDAFERASADRPDVPLNYFADTTDLVPDRNGGKAIRFKVGLGNANNHVRYELERDVSSKLVLSFWVQAHARVGAHQSRRLRPGRLDPGRRCQSRRHCRRREGRSRDER